MDLQIPPHIAAARLLREQLQRKRKFRAWFDELNERWPPGRLTTSYLETFAHEYRARLKEAGGFSVHREGTLPSAGSLSTKGVSIDGQIFWPIAFGQNAMSVNDAYAEQALLICRAGASIRKNKVSVFEAPMGLGITKHALIRLAERGAIKGDFEQQLAGLMPTLIRRSAIVLALSMNTMADDGDQESKTAYVPLGDGVAVCTNRVALSPRFKQDLGWRFSFTRQRYSSTYLKSEQAQPQIDLEGQLYSHVAVSMWFVTTYLSVDQLNSRQRRYFIGADAFLERSSDRLGSTAIGVQFDPLFERRQSEIDAALSDIDEPGYYRIQQMLADRVFVAKPRDGFGFLLEDDATTKSFRDSMRGAASA